VGNSFNLQQEAAGFQHRNIRSSESLCKKMNSSNSSHVSPKPGHHVSVACHLKFGIPNTFSKINHNWDQAAHQYINNIAAVCEQLLVWLPYMIQKK